jgi:hypothetical protein
MSARKAINGLCVAAAVVLTVCLIAEHRAGSRLLQENEAIRQHLARTNEVTAQSQPSSALTRSAGTTRAESDDQETSSAVESRSEELGRLRRELEKLRGQSNQLETLRSDTANLRAQREAGRSRPGSGIGGSNSNGGAAGLEIVQASYGTDHTNIDVADELRDRIRNGTLKAIASNNLKGDPEFGEVKHLTLVYRLNGSIFTNDFHEGDFVVLPNEQQSP